MIKLHVRSVNVKMKKKFVEIVTSYEPIIVVFFYFFQMILRYGIPFNNA